MAFKNEYELHELGPALKYWADTEMARWIGEGHADLVDIVGRGAVRRTTIDTGRLVNNWQAWVGPSTLASQIPEVKSFSPQPGVAYRNIDKLSGEITSKASTGTIIDKSLILNNAPYALVEEEGHGKFMALGACDEAEATWGDGSP